jgi:crotonobetaine/carnitine-CoA ligase
VSPCGAFSGLGDPARWVLPAVLLEQAERKGDAAWFEGSDGERLGFAQAAGEALQIAAFFAEAGVQRGERVAVMLPNGADVVRAWLGLGMLGAVAVLLNTDLRGAFLAHQLRNCGARVAVVDATLLVTVLGCGAGNHGPRRVLVAGAAGPGQEQAKGAGVRLEDFAAWREAGRYHGPLPRAQDIACVMYTSGTSGPAKGVLMPHAHCALYGVGAIEALALGPADRYYIALPLFHANGLLMQLGATLLAGIPALVRTRFSAAAWLADIRAGGATVTNTLGTTAAFVIAQPESALDRDHALRAVLNAPNLPAHETAFRDRFGVRDVLSGFGMTEVNIPVWGRLGQSRPGAAGWVHARHFEVIVADPETDRALAPGELGEILVRPRLPFGFMAGYHALPEQTVAAWRNLWFHTGDAGVFDAEGVLSFVDRIKDCIRRRGENISATEVEAAVATLPGIAEVAACPVPGDIPGTEDEVLLVVVLAPGARLGPAEIIAHADAVLPRFAAPRFVRIDAELPKTATGKLQRAVLRARGAAAAWDRLAPA